MAINIFEKYPGRSNPPSVDYPLGSIKNQTAPGAMDGTPLDQAWANDKEGFFQSILTARGIAANGEVDKVGSSQYYDALAADPTEALRGMPVVASQAETNAGANDAKMVTAKKLRFGFSLSVGDVGHIAFPSWLGGFIVQWGRLRSPSPLAVGGLFSGSVATSTTFPNACFQVVCSDGGQQALCVYSANGLSSSIEYGIRNVSGSTIVDAAGRYIAVGR